MYEQLEEEQEEEGEYQYDDEWIERSRRKVKE